MLGSSLLGMSLYKSEQRSAAKNDLHLQGNMAALQQLIALVSTVRENEFQMGQCFNTLTSGSCVSLLNKARTRF